jgi:predicted Zn-dependent peptidase
MRSNRIVAFATGLALAILSVVALPGESRASSLTPENFKVEKHVLDNGLVVLLREDHSVPAVTFWQWYKVGSRNERPGITGISHYFEHMMFNGSENVPPKAYDQIVESNGGVSNAFTSRDMTPYFEDMASDRLEVLFRIDSDRMRNLTLVPEVLKSELEVVKEERRLRTDNSIFGMLDEQLYAVAFNASPYRWPVVGWMGDLDSMEREDLVEYFHTYYAPNNCILVLVGDFESAWALAKIKEYFADIPAHDPPAEPVNAEPEQRGERRVKVHYPAQQVVVMGGYKVPGVDSKDGYVLDVLSSILGDGESSRFHRSLVYDKQIALVAGTYFATRLQPGLFEFWAMMRPGNEAAEGEAAIYDAIEKIKTDGPTERELQKARNLLEAGFVKGMKTNNGVGQTLGFYEHIYGDHQKMFGVIDMYRAVTIEDCKRVASKYFVAEKRTVAVLVPESISQETAQAAE